ncbi:MULTISPECIES: hypothetical protein [Streptomyces]|uniref:hypothetical protein n=1 Tax=Streptomyces TaxID=1883 RepID=UPI001300C713|nr:MULTISPECIES: hypothetical protein [Streptomyces]WTD25615.1 hypothetical protein OH737_14190 [Streptomyces anulatus]
MAEGTGGKTPQPRRTDFESMTHQQLVALIASASPSGASKLSTKLAQASSTITKIGEDLKEYVSGLPWHGEGGDAFRSWGGQTASATLRLGEYSKGASRWMELVAQAISEAKASMPPVSETTQAQSALAKAKAAYDVAVDPANRNDPDARGLARSAQSDAVAAETRIDVARGEAALRLRKLGQTYEFTAQQVNAETPPTFPPPSTFMPGWAHEASYKPVPGEGPAAPSRPVTGAESVTAPTSPVRPDTVAGAPHPDSSVSPAQPSLVEPATRMEIDGLTTLPPSTPPSPATPPVSLPPVGTSDPRGMPPAPMPHVLGKGAVKPSVPATPPVTGRPGQTGVRPPSLPTQGPVGPGSPARLPRDSGIIGGRPVPPNTTGPGQGIPRGLTVGGEGTPTARGPMGHNPAMGAGNGTVRPGAPGRGRRYASEAGGIVGGNPQQAGRPGTNPLTPGGSGPLSGSSPRQGPSGAAVGRGGAAATPASNSSSRRRDEQGGGRPDYLTEDEDTWKQNGHRIVPPVVE